jgi:hypothetical protein
MLRYKLLAGIGVRGLGRVVTGVGVCAALLLAAPSAQAASGKGSTTCEGGNIAAEITGNLTVPPGAICGLESGGVVDGNVFVGQGAVLFIGGGVVKEDVSVDRGGELYAGECDCQPATIIGDVRGYGAAVIRLRKATVDGDVVLTGTGVTEPIFGEAQVSFGRVNGNVEIDNGQPEAFLYSETVGGSIRILNNLSRSTEGSGETFLEVKGDTVGGNVEIGDNSLLAPVLNRVAVTKTSVANQLLVYNNNLDTTAELPIGRNEMILSSNHVDGAKLLNNTRQAVSGGVGSGRTEVSANAVTNNLNCVGNEPAPVGMENTAKKKLGQCELL